MSAVYDSGFVQKGAVRLNGAFPGTPGSFRKAQVSGYIVSTDGHRGPKQPTISPEFADNQARAKFYKRLREIEVQFSGPTFLGEFRETMHMLRRPLSALHSSAHGYLDALKNAKRASPKHWVKTVSGLWLEKSFGWDPLLKDIEDANAAYNRWLLRLQNSRVVSASFRDYKDSSGALDPSIDRLSTSRQLMSSGIFCRFAGKLWEHCTVRYKGRVKTSAEATRWENAALFGFTPSEFIPTAWALLPWSFLADYVTNIGDILSSAVTSTRNLQYVNKTTIRESHYVGTGTIDEATTLASQGAGFVGTTTGWPGKWEFNRKVVDRVPNSGISLPTLQFSFDLSDKQLLNVAALLGVAGALHPQKPFRPYYRPSRFHN